MIDSTGSSDLQRDNTPNCSLSLSHLERSFYSFLFYKMNWKHTITASYSLSLIHQSNWQILCHKHILFKVYQIHIDAIRKLSREPQMFYINYNFVLGVLYASCVVYACVCLCFTENRPSIKFCICNTVFNMKMHLKRYRKIVVHGKLQTCIFFGRSFAQCKFFLFFSSSQTLFL